MQETWLTDDDNYSHVELKGHKCIPQGKSCSSKDGAIIYLHEKLIIPQNSILVNLVSGKVNL